ncbi:amidase [Alcanivorax sp. JB21]|uniref:amidase n=1 Tax=Alcanivorax limicola TaxID=2874102 RepID=UPI001CBDFAF8|nr:amidase family protein [Alcanivorax limicola]MBZ2188413.1 amidase [Alcanivorax limicola]
MLNTRLIIGTALCATALAGCGGSSSNSASPAPFSFVEATVASVHEAIASGEKTCEDIIQGYLDRIEAYDFDISGPELRSVVRTNPDALNQAIEKDLNFAVTGIDSPLYCIPVLPKDNINTAEMPTSGGITAFEFNQPTEDAYVIERLRDAGAIIIGKANQDELAFGFRGESSIRGLTKNAYDHSRGAGGSSSGSGTSIGASLAIFALGSDTGGSIRVPSSVAGLVGIRPSMRLVSQDGVMPLSSWQDTAGPMCRTVQDCALAMDALVGFDTSPYANQRSAFAIDAPLISSAGEYQSVTRIPASYTAFLEPDGLKGARIGVVRALFGNGNGQNAIVQTVLDDAIAKMRAAGAVVEDVVVPDLSTILSRYSSLSNQEFARDMEIYLQSWTSDMDGHLRTYQAMQDSGGYLDRNANTIASRNNIGEDLSQNESYIRNTVERPGFVRPRLMAALDNIDATGRPAGPAYDVLLYPTLQGLAGSLGGSPSAGSANRMSPFSGFPALSMPAGMAGEEYDIDPALPVGMELLAREFDEATLIRIAYAFQETVKPRATPVHYPDLVADAGGELP